MTDPTIEAVAEDALLLRFGDAIDGALNARVHAAARALGAAQLAGITDIAPAYATLLVRFEPAAWADRKGVPPFERISRAIASIVEGSSANAGAGSATATSGRAIDIPVCYGGAYGPDLDAVARHARLTRAEVVARHTAGKYRVAMLGFAPGFPYLLGLDPALDTPRRANPRTRVPGGAVAIGGAQTGIYPREAPGGWQVIGRTPLALFDPGRDPPCLLAPGDTVRFGAIGAAAFERAATHGP